MAGFAKKNKQLDQLRRGAMNFAFFAETFPWLAPMGKYFVITFVILFTAVFIYSLGGRQWAKQRKELKDWKFDEAYTQEVRLKYPHLTEAEVIEAFEQLRLFFLICWRNDNKLMAMPSKLVDFCWHIFILDTRSYIRFCEHVFDGYFHHEPQNELSTIAQSELVAVFAKTQAIPSFTESANITTSDIKSKNMQAKRYLVASARVFQGAVLLEKMQVLKVNLEDVNVDVDVDAAFIPLLFSIDEKLLIEEGFRYSPEYLKLLAELDIKEDAAAMAALDGVGGGIGGSCGDGGAACGCGGSV